MTLYERKLNEIVDEIFSHFKDWTLTEIAKASRLSVSTVWKLEYRYTKLPRFKTVFQLARAAGMDISIDLNKRVRLKVI